jgi:hypothetical protein
MVFILGFIWLKTLQEKQEGLSHLEYQFPTGHFHKHDPKGLVLQHAMGRYPHVGHMLMTVSKMRSSPRAPKIGRKCSIEGITLV